MTTKINLLAASVLIAVLLMSQSADSSVVRRNADQEDTTECDLHTPCGWAVYKPFTRVIDYFMRNTCKCARDYKCIRTDDDLSVAAYVYRCRKGTEKIDK